MYHVLKTGGISGLGHELSHDGNICGRLFGFGFRTVHIVLDEDTNLRHGPAIHYISLPVKAIIQEGSLRKTTS